MIEDNVGYIRDQHGRVEAVLSVNPDFAAEIDTLEDEWLERFGKLPTHQAIRAACALHLQIVEQETQKTQSQVFHRLVGGLIHKGNSMVAYCIAFATGLDYLNGLSMTDAAKKLKVTRAAISKNAIEWCDLLNLPRSRYMKSEKACEAYSKVQTEDHWRNRKTPFAVAAAIPQKNKNEASN